MTRTFGEGINPFNLVIAIAIVGGIIGWLSKFNIWIAPGMFVVMLGSAVFIALQYRAQSRRDAGAVTTVNHARLGTKSLTPLAPWLKDNVRGHDQIIDKLCAEIDQQLSLARPGKTLGAYLLVGPTGTGKTFLAQLIAQALYPDSAPVIVRMNQYKSAGDVFTLMGPPPGMPGYEVGGSLTRSVLDNPYRVVIFDELEKAHPDLQHCLYDVLDVAATREKSSGRLVDFSGCLFFATCNAGAEELRAIEASVTDPIARLGRSRDVLSKAGFERAFLARWSGIYLMDELQLLNVAEVACLQLARRWGEYGIEVEYAAPEIILNAVQRNEEFRQYGVRQLGSLLQTLTNDAIVDARKRGAKRVRLAVRADGGLSVVEAPLSAQLRGG